MLSESIVNVPGIRPVRSDRLSALSFVAFAILLLASGWLAHSNVLNHDSGWYLEATRKLLAGGRLYQDIVEINPPLAFFLHVPPVWLAGVVGASPVSLFFAWVFAAIGVSLVLCHITIRKLPISASERISLLAAILVGLILGSWQGLGQREHFLMILILPYLFLAVARASAAEVNRTSAITIGALAAIGFALKPHFLLIPLAIEIYLRLIRRGNAPVLRPETAVVAIVIVGYWILVAVFTPLYFTRIIPWALTTYGSYSASLFDVLWRGETIILPAAVLVGATVRRPGVLRTVVEIALLSAVCFWLIHLMQMKGFQYHRFPIRTALIVGLCASFLATIGVNRSEPGRLDMWRRLPTIGASLLLGITLGWLVDQGTYRNRFIATGLPVMQAQARSGARTIYVFSSNVWQAFPAANYAGLRSVSRYPAHWLLPGITLQSVLQNKRTTASERQRAQSIKRFVLDSVIEDFRRGEPDLVLVDVRRKKPHFGGVPFDYLKHFSADPRFAAIWSRYDRIAAVKGFTFYSRRRQ